MTKKTDERLPKDTAIAFYTDHGSDPLANDQALECALGGRQGAFLIMMRNGQGQESGPDHFSYCLVTARNRRPLTFYEVNYGNKQLFGG